MPGKDKTLTKRPEDTCENSPAYAMRACAMIFGGLRDRVTHMAETDLEKSDNIPANIPADVLVTQIESTRADLARTIDEIADRVSPANVARRTGDRIRERISQIDPLVGGAVALAAVSVTCFIVWRRIRK